MQYLWFNIRINKIIIYTKKNHSKKSKVLVCYLIKAHESLIIKLVVYLFTFQSLKTIRMTLLGRCTSKLVIFIKSTPNKVRCSFTFEDTKVSNLFFYLKIRFAASVKNGHLFSFLVFN